ncbi:MAG TPA: hypothetical protein VLE95_01100 [Chlamydiales bacterium]|nr:hypothetical protein [Chlamydiales bacterium]
MPKSFQFSIAKETVLKNLETLQMSLVQCVEEGMVDVGNNYYNEILDLLDDAHTLQGWDALEEAIARAKTLEMGIAVWLARHGRTTVSLTWPKTI